MLLPTATVDDVTFTFKAAAYTATTEDAATAASTATISAAYSKADFVADYAALDSYYNTADASTANTGTIASFFHIWLLTPTTGAADSATATNTTDIVAAINNARKQCEEVVQKHGKSDRPPSKGGPQMAQEGPNGGAQRAART